MPTGWKKTKLDHFLPRFESTQDLESNKKRSNNTMRRQRSQKRKGVITRQQGSQFSTRTPGFQTSSDRERENKFYLPSLSRVFIVVGCSLAYFHDLRHSGFNVMFKLKKKHCTKTRRKVNRKWPLLITFYIYSENRNLNRLPYSMYDHLLRENSKNDELK